MCDGDHEKDELFYSCEESPNLVSLIEGIDDATGEDNKSSHVVRKKFSSSLLEEDLPMYYDNYSLFYNINKYRYRGYCLIFNQYQFDDPKLYENRDGTQSDVTRILTVMATLNIECTEYHDLTHEEILNEVRRLRYDEISLEKITNSAFLIVFILTHGGPNGQVMARDKSYSIYSLIDEFKPIDNFLLGKPKMFFIQACRGIELDMGCRVQVVKRLGYDQTDATPYYIEVKKFPLYQDIFIGNSSFENCPSFRNELGSWFIQDLCEVLCNKDLHVYDLNELMQFVMRRVANRTSVGEIVGAKQICVAQTTMLKKFKFIES